MQYIIEYENGKLYSSLEIAWRNLPRNEKIISMGIWDNKGNFHTVNNCDVYFFSDEAIYLAGHDHIWEARLIGGFKNGKGTVYRVPMRGTTEIIETTLEKWQEKYNCLAFIENF